MNSNFVAINGIAYQLARIADALEENNKMIKDLGAKNDN